AIGKSNAESYKLSVDAMGGDNFTKLKVTEQIGKERIKIIPEVLITGGGEGQNGPINGLLGLQLLDGIMDRNSKKEESEKKDQNPKNEGKK
ncbi:MAG: flotillin family protein, partial [Bacteroidota bacterium]|nr:flotillin family protein [Bacteroidota bacterium]